MASEGTKFIVLAESDSVSDAEMFEGSNAADYAIQYAQDEAAKRNEGMWIFQSVFCVKLSQGDPENVDG